ncbi:MAG: glycosyltransferase family 39 protein, partial [Acidobacteriota bacterium]
PLVFLAGRRLFGVRAGLLASLLLAYLPWTVHSSGYNKPDALLMMGVCLALFCSLRAVETAKPTDFAAAGVAIALAMSAKLTGGLAAVPLVIATLFFVHRPAERWRRLGLLPLAGATSALAFVLMNPYWRAYLHFIRSLQKDYAGRTAASPWEMPRQVAEMHLGDLLFGPLLGALALVAFGLLTVALARDLVISRRRARPPAPQSSPAGPGEPVRPETVPLAMFLAFPICYTAAYAAQTSYFKPNNFLPVVPFTALALAWLLDAGWSRLARRLPAGLRTPAASLAIAALAAALFLPAFRYVHRSVVPTTFDLARSWLETRLDPPMARSILFDDWKTPEPFWEGSRALHRGLSHQLRLDLADATADQLHNADAVLVRRDLPDRDAIIETLTAGGAEALSPEPRLLEARGPPLTALVNPWRRVSEVSGALSLGEDERTFLAAVPEELARRGRWTLFVWIPETLLPPGVAPEVFVKENGPPLELMWMARKGK